MWSWQFERIVESELGRHPPAPPTQKKDFEGRAAVEKKTDIPSVGQLGQVGDDDLMDASS